MISGATVISTVLSFGECHAGMAPAAGPAFNAEAVRKAGYQVQSASAFAEQVVRKTRRVLVSGSFVEHVQDAAVGMALQQELRRTACIVNQVGDDFGVDDFEDEQLRIIQPFLRKALGHLDTGAAR